MLDAGRLRIILTRIAENIKMASTDDISQKARDLFDQATKTPDPSVYLLEFYRRFRVTASQDTVVAMLLALDGQVEEQNTPPIAVLAMREAAAELGNIDPRMAFYFYRALGRELLYCRSKESLKWTEMAVLVGETVGHSGDFARDLQDLKKGFFEKVGVWC